jgi:hypothetical protein
MVAPDFQFPHSNYGTYSMEESQILDGATVVDDAFSFINFDGNSNTSAPTSQYDGYEREYIMSPVSTIIPGLRGAVSGSYPPTMSPDPIHRGYSPYDTFMDEDSPLSSEESLSDHVLDSLITSVVPTQNEDGEDIYRCRDVHAPNHSCDYEDKRKCNLR